MHFKGQPQLSLGAIYTEEDLGHGAASPWRFLPVVLFQLSALITSLSPAKQQHPGPPLIGGNMGRLGTSLAHLEFY